MALLPNLSFIQIRFHETFHKLTICKIFIYVKNSKMAMQIFFLFNVFRGKKTKLHLKFLSLVTDLLLKKYVVRRVIIPKKQPQERDCKNCNNIVKSMQHEKENEDFKYFRPYCGLLFSSGTLMG